MTTPNGNAPDGAYVIGSRFGQDQTESSIRQTVQSPPLNAWQVAQDAWKEMCRGQYKTQADLQDGQNAIRDRLDLLGDSSGYGCAFMGYNWWIDRGRMTPYGTWKVLPFDTQLGPMKNVSVIRPNDDSGWLCLKAGGLWRVDVLLTAMGHEQHSQLIPPGPTDYTPITPQYMIEVLDAAGDLVTAREFNQVADIVMTGGYIAPTTAPVSCAFADTFVIPDMPPEDDPSAPDSWHYVRVSIKVDGHPRRQANFVTCQSLGGTKMSGMWVSRWSKDAVNLDQPIEVPDGGVLV